VSERIAITGLGILAAPGRGVARTLGALREGSSGLGPLGLFDSPRCGHFPVGEVRDVPFREGESRTVRLASIALAEALHAAHLVPLPGDRAGLCLGTCVGGMPETERAVVQLLAGGEPPPAVWARHECGSTTASLAESFGFHGPTQTLSTACSSSAQAIACAAELVESGETDVVVAGGADALCNLTLNGFASLLAVDPEGCRPFDRRRAGMSLGEGAAFCVLESEEHALSRGAPPLAFLLGHGNTCDAHHPTAPDPDGRGAERAMRQALEYAGLAPGSVDYVNAHGTGTPDNDRAESRALRRLFGESPPPVSSTKRIFGHTLGAAGAIEAVVSVLALTEGFLPGNPGFEELDPECALEPLGESRSAAPRVVLSNSFGFGGNNTVLCFGAAEVGR
jgi:3-oxoacyl-(acyl-carrier-protein) synthase